jgi:hypothetical protein
MHSLTNVAPMLSSFERCQYFPKETSCRCFYASDLRQVSYIFRGTDNCRVVQFDLRNMVYGISGVYGAGLAVCLIAGVLECLLLCPTRRTKVIYTTVNSLHLDVTLSPPSWKKIYCSSIRLSLDPAWNDLVNHEYILYTIAKRAGTIYRPKLRQTNQNLISRDF